MHAASTWIDRLYHALTQGTDGDADAANSIGEKARRELPGNFLRLILARACSKLADRLASPKTTLTWLLQTLGAPPLFAGLVVPVREAGSILPQILFSIVLSRMPRRKWAWVLGAVLQAAAIAGCGLAALHLRGAAAGGVILGLLVCFSFARGFSSIASKDILGKVVPKSQRGQLNGWVASTGGVMAMAAGALLLFRSSEEGSVTLYVAFLLCAALLWAAAALAHSRVREFPGKTRDGSEIWKETKKKLWLLREDPAFRSFVGIRALAMGSGLSAPYIIALAHERLGGAAFWLGIFILTEGLATMISSPLWGRFSDRSSRTVLRLAMLGTAVLLLAVTGFTLAPSAPWADQILFPLFFFLLGLMHSGVRLGRKTYLVDMAEGNQRTDYVAVSNTVIGVLLLLAGALTGLLALWSIPLTLLVFAACALAGAALGGKLPEVSA